MYILKQTCKLDLCLSPKGYVDIKYCLFFLFFCSMKCILNKISRILNFKSYLQCIYEIKYLHRKSLVVGIHSGFEYMGGDGGLSVHTWGLDNTCESYNLTRLQFLCILGDAKLLSAIEDTIHPGCHSLVLCLVVNKHINKCFKFQGNLIISLEDMYS